MGDVIQFPPSKKNGGDEEQVLVHVNIRRLVFEKLRELSEQDAVSTTTALNRAIELVHLLRKFPKILAVDGDGVVREIQYHW